MDEHMVLKDHLIHLLTLNMDKYITTNKNTEASPDQPISHSHRHLLWAGQALPYGGKNNNKKKNMHATSAESKWTCAQLVVCQSVPKYLWPKCVGATAWTSVVSIVMSGNSSTMDRAPAHIHTALWRCSVHYWNNGLYIWRKKCILF